jgi:hypothetical protein
VHIYVDFVILLTRAVQRGVLFMCWVREWYWGVGSMTSFRLCRGGLQDGDGVGKSKWLEFAFGAVEVPGDGGFVLLRFEPGERDTLMEVSYGW